MPHQSFSDVKDAVLKLIEPALHSFERGSGADLADLQSVLRQLLDDLMRLVDRDPGIETAAADLKAAASALVRENTDQQRGSPRTLRLFRDARARLHERILTARPSVAGTRAVLRQHELMRA